MMSKTTVLKWGLLVAGSTVATLQLGACIAHWLLQTWVLNVVN
jgi:hypothetical protein